jgi:hypothetical protein
VTVMEHRTRDGLADYGFSIEYESTRGWRVYTVFSPFQQGYDDSSRLPYQSIDNNGRCYVDWPDRIDSLGDAKTVAALWAELVHRYQWNQEQHLFYAESINRILRIRQQKRTDPPDSDRLGAAVGAGGAPHGDHDCGSVIHCPGAAAKSLSDLQEGKGLGLVADEVA